MLGVTAQGISNAGADSSHWRFHGMVEMSFNTVLLIAGLVCLALVITGGGLSVGGVSLPGVRGRHARVAFGVLAGVLLVAAVVVYQSEHEGAQPQPGPTSSTSSPTGTRSPSVPTSPPTAPPPLAAGTISSPKRNQPVRVSAGVTVTGSVSHLRSGETLWLFDQDLSNEYRYYFVNDDPLDLTGSDYSYPDEPIGDQSDPDGTTYPIVLVVANTACGQVLKETGLNLEGDRAIKSLPPGCRILARVEVVKSGP